MGRSVRALKENAAAMGASASEVPETLKSRVDRTLPEAEAVAGQPLHEFWSRPLGAPAMPSSDAAPPCGGAARNPGNLHTVRPPVHQFGVVHGKNPGKYMWSRSATLKVADRGGCREKPIVIQGGAGKK